MASIVYSPFTFGALFAAVSALSTLEFCRIVNKQEGVHTNPFICVLSSILLYFAFFAYSCGYANAMLIIPSSVFLPYLVTIVVLVITSLRKKREDQPPACLGIAYFRESRG